jgi:hypothetical protein
VVELDALAPSGRGVSWSLSRFLPRMKKTLAETEGRMHRRVRRIARKKLELLLAKQRLDAGQQAADGRGGGTPPH